MRASRLRAPHWKRETPKKQPEGGDDAQAMLQALAANIERHAADVLRGDVRAQCGVPIRTGYAAPAAGSDRAWRYAVDGCQVWCVLDAQSQRSLLESVLDGPGATTLTTVERTIIAESLARMLGASGPTHRLSEEARERPPAAGMWRCDVDLCSVRHGRTAIALFAAAKSEPAPTSVPAPHVRDVPLDVRAQLAPVSIALHAMQAWHIGSTVRVADGLAARARLTIERIGVAGGDLGTSAGRRAIRLADLT
jgi:Type III flagellar switch regulator (C-ring) FliN C-term